MTRPEFVDCVKSLSSVCVSSFVFVYVCTVHMCFSSGKEEQLMPITKRIIINQSIKSALHNRGLKFWK